MMVLSYIPCIQATQPPNERVRRGAVGVGQQTGSKSSLPPCPRIAFGPWRPRKGRPRPLRKTGAYRPNGVRGVGGWGARPPGTRLLNAAAPIQFLLPHLVFECCGPAPQGCRKAFLALRLATLPRAGTPWEGKRGVEVWPCAPFAFFKCAPQRTATARRKSGSLVTRTVLRRHLRLVHRDYGCGRENSRSSLILDIQLSRLPARPQPRWRRRARSRSARSLTRAPRRSTH
jgi:hypothetical protein